MDNFKCHLLILIIIFNLSDLIKFERSINFSCSTVHHAQLVGIELLENLARPIQLIQLRPNYAVSNLMYT